jgi:hypothetical protein
VHCANAPTPFDGRRFFRDFVAELHRLAEKDEPAPYYPQRLWFVALATADAKDRFRFVSRLNARGDTDYLERQHIYRLPTSDDFNLRNGEPLKIPQIDLCPAPRFPDRRGTWQTERKAERERAATANGNGVTRAAAP